MFHAAFRAHQLTHRQWQVVQVFPVLRAGRAADKPAICYNHNANSDLGLVIQLPPEIMVTHVSNGAYRMAVERHTIHVQILVASGG